MTRLTFAQRLAAARRLLAHGPTSMPDHLADQMQAAGTEVRKLHDRIGTVLSLIEPERNWRERMVTDPSDEVRAYLLAGLLGCTQVCPHLRRGGPQPTIVRLPLRRVDCARCVQTLRKPPAGEDDICDLCGAPETLTFVPFAVRQGPALITGDVCIDCAGVLGILEAAA